MAYLCITLGKCERSERRHALEPGAQYTLCGEPVVSPDSAYGAFPLVTGELCSTCLDRTTAGTSRTHEMRGT